MLKIGIIGVGGVGGYIGAKLIKKGLARVTFFARGESYRVIKEKGLKINDTGEEFVVFPQGLIDSDSDDASEIFDIIFIATKTYHFKDIAKNLALHVDENTLIIPLSNGINHKVELSSYLSKGVVLDGCVYILSNIEEAGFIHKKAKTFYLIFGDFKNRFQSKLQRLADILNESGLKTKLSQNIEYDCWVKYLLISSFATLTSYYKEPMGFVLEHKFTTLKEVLKEICAVANAQGVDIGESEIEKTIKQIKNIPYESKTSMQLDFEQNSRTELESLCGYIVKEAKISGAEVKNMQMAYEKLKG